MKGERVLRRLLVPRVPTHEATSAHLRGVLPFQASHALGGRGAYLGRDTSGAAFCFDAFQAVSDGVISGPGMLVLGEIGRGKSSCAKCVQHLLPMTEANGGHARSLEVNPSRPGNPYAWLPTR